MSDPSATIAGMVFCDYFAASDDATALRVLDESGPDPAVFDVVPLKGVDPVVVLVALEGILTGCTYDEASARPRSGELLSSPEEGEPLVVGVSDTLQEALAQASHGTLAEAAPRWAAIEEMRQWAATPKTALGILTHLAGLAARARTAGMRLYCWWAL